MIGPGSDKIHYVNCLRMLIRQRIIMSNVCKCWSDPARDHPAVSARTCLSTSKPGGGRDCDYSSSGNHLFSVIIIINTILDLELPYKCKFNFLVWQPSGWTPWFPFAVSFYWRLYFSRLLFGEGLLSLSISAISLCLFIPGECNHDMMILLILGSLKILRLFTSSSFLHCRKVSLSGHYLDIVTLCCKIFWIFNNNNNNNKNNENNNNSSIDILQTQYIA